MFICKAAPQEVTFTPHLLNRHTIVQKNRDFIHSLTLLFITEERLGRGQLMGGKKGI